MSKGKRIRGNTLNKRISDICEKLAFDAASFFSWDHEFNSLAELDEGLSCEISAAPVEHTAGTDF